MIELLQLFLHIVASLFKPRARLEAEILVLRQQLNVEPTLPPSMQKIAPIDPAHTKATSFWNPGRSIVPDPDRPRSLSMITTDAKPIVRADSAKAYWRRRLSVFSATCPMLDCRT